MNPPWNAAGLALTRSIDSTPQSTVCRISGNNAEVMDLEPSDHPGMILVITPLTGDNFLSWKRLMHLALGAKGKLGFVDGELIKPAIDSPDYQQWKRNDCMVFSWILNSLSKDIAYSFVFANSSKELWDKICKRYEEPRGPHLYRIHKEIASIRQGTDSLEIYFGKLNKLWGEYASLTPLPVCTCSCTCGAEKAISDHEENTKLFQFLMGLNDSYAHVRNQVLFLDSLPSVNKAYTMVRTVESLRDLCVSFPGNTDNVAMSAKSGGYNRSYDKGGVYKRTKEEKARLVCDHCKGPGHEVVNCFKLHGIPDWYKNMREQQNMWK